MNRASPSMLYIDSRPPTQALRQILQKVFGQVVWVGSLADLAAALKKFTPTDRPKLFMSELSLSDGKTLDWIRSQPSLPGPWVMVSKDFDAETVIACLKAGVRDLFRKGSIETIELAKLEFYAEESRVPVTDVNSPRQHLEREITLDPYMRTVTCRSGSTIQCTPMEFKILVSIHQAFPGGLDRHRLFRMLWGDRKVVPKALDVHIFNLRRKLEDFSYQVRSTPNGEFRLARNTENTQKGESEHEYADPA